MTTTLSVADYLKYANLQMASEALIRDPITRELNADLVGALVRGNKHASVFTEVQARDFAAQWDVVDQKANTSTGFSGTLFRNKASGDLVLSFRSTEFIDDAARDNQATNTLEITKYGFAFGQLRDMEDWYRELSSTGGPLAGNASFAVTGYSLGGHLATAFNMLHNTDRTASGTLRIKEVVTFNGAGVGGIAPNTDLAQVISRFKRLSENASGQEFTFTDADLADLYARARQSINAGGSISAADRSTLDAYVNASAEGPVIVDAQTKQQASMVRDAIVRIDTIRSEVARLQTISSGDPDNNSRPLNVLDSSVGQENLDYQMAVLTVQASTGAASLAGGVVCMLADGKRYGGTYANQFDVVGDTSPSAVANSQWHWGNDVRVSIEDQPLYRGGVVAAAALESFSNGGVKLLVDGYATKDFGDTHSLSLIVDSLSVQNMLAQLLPVWQRNSDTTGATLKQMLQQASYLIAQHGGAASTDPGKAEGDVLENVVNALADLALGPNQGERLKGSPDGGTWYRTDNTGEYTGRTALHALLEVISQSPLYQRAAAGAFSLALTADTDGLQTKARTDFGAFTALYSASPFMLTLGSGPVETAAGNAWGDIYTAWSADRTRAASGAPNLEYTFTDQWLADREEFLARKDWFNLNNRNPLAPTSPVDPASQGMTADSPYLTDSTYFEDVASDYSIAQGFNPDAQPRAIRRFYFGDGQSNTYAGGASTDHLYGGAGNDTLDGDGDNDYLEGNAGADQLIGGDGADSLIGGDGDDRLDGGHDSDQLRGGIGNDRYVFGENWGHDVIEDSNGQGSIEVSGLGPLDGSGAEKVSSRTWQTEGERITYSLVANADDPSRDDLVIRFASPRTDTITIRNWSNNSVGITLPDNIVAPVTNAAYMGDFIKQLSDGTTYARTPEGNYVSAGSQAGSQDVITGTADADLIQGMGGNDGLVGGAGDDVVEGGEADDLLIGGMGSDTLNGGAGHDYIFGSGSGALTYPTGTTTPPIEVPGVESIRGASWVVATEPSGGWSVYGYDGGAPLPDDTGNIIDAGADSDWVAAGTGSDVVQAGSGDDIVYGMAGNDTIYGGTGADDLSGDSTNIAVGNYNYTDPTQHGVDLLVGESGNDRLVGNGGNDALYGGADDDELLGDDDSDTTPVEAQGNDYLDAGAGNDRLVGGGRDDVLLGGANNDTLRGDDSASRLPGAAHGDDHLEGEEGDDVLQGDGGADTLYGGIGNDKLVGDTASNTPAEQLDAAFHGDDFLDGGDGNDTIYGAGGSDTLFGGRDHDVLLGDDDVSRLAVSAHGDDYLDGEDGDDILIGAGGDDVLLGGAGNDFISGDDQFSAQSVSLSTGNDYIEGGDGNDDLLGGNGRDTLLGGDGDDALFGGDGNDYLEGGAGTDSQEGGKGDDILVTDGRDYLDGGEGNDTYRVAFKPATLVNGVLSLSAPLIADNVGINVLETTDADVSAAAAQIFTQDGGTYLSFGASA